MEPTRTDSLRIPLQRGERSPQLWYRTLAPLLRSPATHSMQQIADRLRIKKASLYYHFASKGHIAGSLVEPLADDPEDVLESAERKESWRKARAAVIEGYLDVMLRYRKSFLLLVHDIPMDSKDFYERLFRLTAQTLALITRPNADLGGRIRATQAISALENPLLMLPDVPDEELREPMLDGAWRLLEEPSER